MCTLILIIAIKIICRYYKNIPIRGLLKSMGSKVRSDENDINNNIYLLIIHTCMKR